MSADRVRLRRSVLFMPASNARALEKARTLPADAVVFDLEDAVAPEAKAAARQQAVAAANAGGARQSGSRHSRQRPPDALGAA